MDAFMLVLQRVMHKPTLVGLQMVCSQIESWESYMPTRVKDMAQKAVTAFVAEGSLAAEEDMLRLYKILGKYSRKMGAAAVFEKVEEQGRFKNSLKFHILWAESYAKNGDVSNFSRILELAKRRLTHLTLYDLEAGFRDIAEQYFPSNDFFADEEETMAVFNIKKPVDPKARRNRRRSSLAVIEARAKDTFKLAEPPKVGSFGPNTRTKLRFELIDRHTDSYVAPSVEEIRAAKLADEQMTDGTDIIEDVPMDITVTQSEVAVARPALATVSEVAELGKRNRILETVEECESDSSNEDKRRRILSPAAPARTSVFTARAQKSPPPKTSSSVASTQPSSSRLLSGSSFSERAYSDMKAMFSDTVVINKGNLPGISDETTLPVAAPAVEAFDVYVDEEMPQPSAESESHENNQRQTAIHHHNADRMPLQPISVQDAAGDAESELLWDNFDLKDIPKPKKSLFIEDEETVAGAKFTTLGVDKKLDRGIVTSTPAHPFEHQPTHEDFFASASRIMEEEKKNEQNEEEIYAQSTFMRRRSLAPSHPVVVMPKPTIPKPRTVQAAERSMEVALDKMNIGDSHQVESEVDADGDGDHNRTGIGLVDEAVTSAVNPWSRKIRCEILKQCRKPCYQHDFETSCPRVVERRTVNFGGESFNIVALVGQGGFAKVYKCINEEGNTLALKYEIPSCPWEVYICSEAKMRIDRSKKFILDSIMEVTEAYVFNNASVLFNEYHSHGTLLDLSNKWVDPSWYIVALIGIQIAKILRELHAVKIIHGDIKPDNFMIRRPLSDCHDNIEEILSTPIVKLIDFGRAIDMRVFGGQTFSGRAGTKNFDCPEMMDGRPWTYQTDYFGYVGTMHVLVQNKYAVVTKQDNIYKVATTMKRRFAVRDALEAIYQEFLNIPDCSHFPCWDKAIHSLEEQFRLRFNAMEWRQSVSRFNSLI